MSPEKGGNDPPAALRIESSIPSQFGVKMRRTRNMIRSDVVGGRAARLSVAKGGDPPHRRGSGDDRLIALVLAKLMGHADTRMLARVYAHVEAGVLVAAVRTPPETGCEPGARLHPSLKSLG